MKKSLLLTLMFALIATLGFSQTDKFWSANNESRGNIITDKAVARQSFPKEFKLFTVNIEPLRLELFSIVDNRSKRSTVVISLPNAEGQLEQFEVHETSNFEPALQARFPEIRAYTGKGLTDKSATLKLSISPQGIQAMVFRTSTKNEFIEPFSKDHSVYAVFKSQREKGKLPWTCSTEDKQFAAGIKLPQADLAGSSTGELKTMRLAQSCNGEYSNYFGAFNAGQVALVLAAYNATLTRCNGCYEKDLALHLNLIANTTDVIYYDPLTDPYTTMGSWNGQLQATLTAVIGEANYDIGHMFGASGGGGNAGCIGCVCVNGIKGSGITSPADGIPQGDNFDIDYVAHEVGHQLGGNHTFSMGIEAGGVNNVEVGSGITIMGYAGITSQDVAPHSIDIFHERTIQQIQLNLAGKTCPITTNITANNATPVVAPVGNFTIPITTPFALTGSATDANPGDVLTYCWEQNDAANSTVTGNNSVAFPGKLVGPNWLSFPATTNPVRMMPRLSTILAGLYVTPVLPGGDPVANIEALSSVSRDLNFRLTVRDNSAYVPVSPGPAKVGQTAFTDMTVTVTNTSGPFQVTAPNTNVTWPGGSTQAITWDVNGTTGAPVSCANVKISLSTDGGTTFPTVLAASTPNDGTESLLIPSVTSTTARIKVEAVGNIFFDISNTNFNITGGPAAPLIVAGTATITAEGCVPTNGVIDPNETVSISFCLQNTGTSNTTNLVGTLLATGGVTSPSAPQSYGVVVFGGAPVCRTFSFTANTSCGGTVTASIQLQDGATNLGTITYNFVTGVVTTSFTQNFDAVAAPALPAGWVATNASGAAPLWETSATTPNTAPNALFVNDPAAVSDKIIETPTIAITAPGASLSFRNNYTLESGFDGGVLEISINAAAYQDIIAAGGVFTSAGYNGTISSSFGNPLAARQAWTGTAGSYLTSTVTLPPAAAGQNIKLRFRMGSDNSVSATGWRVDDITISQRSCCVPVLNPNVTINQAAAQADPTSAQPINYTVVFDQVVTGFATGDVTLTGTAGASSAIVTGSGTTYNVAVSGMTSSGTVIASIAAGVCQNAASNPNNASTSTDNTVTFNAPVGCTSVNPVANQTLCNGASTTAVNFTSPTAGTTFSWINNTTSIGLGASGNGNIPSFIATNATAAPVVATITVTPTLTLVTPTTTTFNFTGGAQTFTVPAGVTSINFTALGAEGGSGAIGGNGATGGAGGRGSRSTGTLAVTAGQVINIFVGGAGGAPTAGFNGGGTGGNANSGGGGGASDVRFPGAASTDRILVAGGGGGGGRGGCEGILGAPGDGGTGGNGDGNGVNGANSATFGGGFAGGGFGAIGTTPGAAGIGCAGFLGAPGLAGSGAAGGNGGGGQTCCCFNFASVPGGGGGGGGFLGGAGGGGGSAGTVACQGNDKGGGGGGAGGTSYTGGVTAGVVTTNIQTGNGQVVLNYNVTTVCTGPSLAFTITVNPTPTVNAVANQVVCRNAPTAAVNFTGATTGTVYNWTNNTVAIGLAASGTGNIASFIAQNPGNTPLVATITVTPSYTNGGSTCTGTARTFTITVNPNPDLIIVADPGTILCEGDPTLLTVYNQAGFAPVNLTQSTSTTITAGNSVACNAGGLHTDNSYWRAYNLAALALPSALTVTTVTFGIEQAAGGAQPVTVRLYTQNAGPAFPGGTRTLVGTQAASVPNQTNSLFTVTFGTPVVVPNTAVLIVELFTPNGQGTGRSFFIGSNAAAQTGTTYLSAPDCGITNPTDIAAIGFPNMHIILNVGGTIPGAGTIATGTFLWSPAAGLSSTTSNPVAASPMNTTTYTVVRTTVPDGCVASAQITITVNKRPVVTTQPIASVNCVGTTATFTVGGTGTGLTYQWQERTTPAGAWNNLTNIAPYSGVTTPTLTINPVNQLMSGYAYRCVLSGTCPAIGIANISNPAILTVNPNPSVSITPAVSCGGVAGISGTLLSVGSAPPPIPGAVTVNSGVISVLIPDGTGVAATSNLTVAGIPANATITEVKVNMNINHTWVGDVDVNLRAPNLAILNLVGSLNGGTGGNAGNDFTNTAFSSLGGLAISGAADPRTGTFAAEARAGFGPIGFIQTVNNWPALTPTATSANGVWTLAMGDFAAGDEGTLTNWSIVVNYTTPGGGSGPTLTYVWSPLAGLYTNATATIPYTGTNTASVYAAPTVQTVYTVRATDVATGCFTDATALVNYTPPAPLVTPSSVTMCLGDPAVKLKASTSTQLSTSSTSGVISVPITDNSATATTNALTISGIPAGATITSMTVALNMVHTYPADMVINLRAPNGQILSLYKHNTNTDNGAASIPTAGFFNAVVSSSAATAFSAVPSPYRYGITAPAGPYRADALNGVTNPGYPVIMDPTGFASNAAAFSSLYSTPNGTYTLAMCDGGPADLGTFQGWTLTVNYLVGVLATPAVWSPAAGLFSDAAATVPYVAGTAVDSVWTRPTPSGVYPYTVTVNNVISTLATPVTPLGGTNTNAVILFNVRNNNAYPVTFSSISSNASASGAVTSRVFFKATPIAGAPGAINAGNGWNQFGSGASTVTAGVLNQLISGLTLVIPPATSYGIALEMLGVGGPAYTNGTGTVIAYSNAGCDIITDGNVGWGAFAVPAAPANNPRNFNGSVTFLGSGAGTCQSPARTVIVTVNQPTTVATQPVAQTICTDKVTTFSVVAAGTGPFTYRWELSTNGNNPPWTTVVNGGVYSGATTATLTITAPPVTLNGNFYRCVITGAAPCAAATSNGVRLGVNPLPVVVITASPLTSLFPGLRTTLSSTVSPNAAATYTWLRNGVTVAGATTGTLGVDVDGLGNYTLRVTDVNGCTSTSNMITIKDSASGRCFLYPNPTSGKFQVRYYSVANNVLPRSLTISDAKGDRVFTQMYQIGRPYDRMDVDMRAYGKGLYWVEIGDLNGNRLAICRVVIQ